MSSINYSIETKGKTNKHTIIWRIPQTQLKSFIREIQNEDTDITNRELYPEILKTDPVTASKSRFQVKIKSMFKSISIYYLSTVPVLLKVVLISNLCNCRMCLKMNTNFRTVSANKWQYMCTMDKHLTMLISRELRDKRDEFYLRFDFFVTEIKVEQTKSPEVQLSNDFENLLNNDMYSDVTMKSADGVEYKVHKVVLASRSAVLKAHFEHNTIECATNIAESPLESELLHEVLTFIYSGKAPRIDEIPEKLLAAADYYQLGHLKNLCEEALQKKLIVENAIETLRLADLHSANVLRQVTLEFIKNGPTLPAIIKTEGWAKLNSVELIKEIIDYCLSTV